MKTTIEDYFESDDTLEFSNEDLEGNGVVQVIINNEGTKATITVDLDDLLAAVEGFNRLRELRDEDGPK